MDHNSLSGKIESTSDAIFKIYAQDLRKKIQEHWTALDMAAGMEKREFLEKFGPTKGGFWFGDVSFHFRDLEKRMSHTQFCKFPTYIASKKVLNTRLIEFNYLFPKDSLTEAFLPVLLTGYLQKRSTNDSFVENLYAYQNSTSVDFKKKSQMYMDIPSLEEAYSGLYNNPKARKVSSKNILRAFKIYQQIMIFLVILRAVSHKCNVTLSFYMYEILTGALSLLNKYPEKCFNRLDKLEPQQILADPTELHCEIIEYIGDTIDDFAKIRTSNPHDILHDAISSIPFLTFLGKLRYELYGQEETDDMFFSDCSDTFAIIDWRHHCDESEDPLYPIDDTDF